MCLTLACLLQRRLTRNMAQCYHEKLLLACQDIWEVKKTGIQRYPGWWQLKYFMIFLPNFGEDAQFDQYLSKGLVQPPTNTLFNPPNTESVTYKLGKTTIKTPKEIVTTAFWRMGEWEAQSDLKIRLVEEILHHLGLKKLVNNGVNYQPQLVSLPDFWLPSTVCFFCPNRRPTAICTAICTNKIWELPNF